MQPIKQPPKMIFGHMLMNIQDAEKNLLPVGSLLTKSPSLLNVRENFMPILILGFGNISTYIFKFSFLWYMQKRNKMSVCRQKREKFWNYVIWNCWQLIYIYFVFSVVFQKLWFLSISELWLWGLVALHFKTLVWTTLVRVCFFSRCVRDNILGGWIICC